MINVFANYANSKRRGVLGPLCYKLITFVNYYLETGLTCFLLPKSFVSAHFHCMTPFVNRT